MFVADLALAFVVAFLFWYASSWVLARFIYHVETNNPAVMKRASWSAVESILTLVVFVGSVGFWLGLTYLLDRLNP